MTLQEEALQAGRTAGWDAANYAAAYGGNVTHITVPDRYATVDTYYTAGFEAGVQIYEDGGESPSQHTEGE